MQASVAGSRSISSDDGANANGSRRTRLRRSGAGSHPSNEPAAVKVPAMIEKTIKRDPEGRFARHGKAISKTKRKKNSQIAVALNKGKIMPKSLGRPKGS